MGSLHEQLNARDAQIARYRVALGVDPASKGALVELNNQELALKTQAIVARLRQFSSELDEKSKAIDQRVSSGEIDKSKVGELKLNAMKEVSQDFDTGLASDTYNVENELRSRLDSSAMSHVITVPALMGDGDPRSRITFPDMFRGTGFDVLMLRRLADEMEQMAKLLPPDTEKQ
jgi:hypothetical protein